MTRPMPEPPEYVESGLLGDWDREGRWRNNWNLYWADGSAEYGVWERPDKHLTDAECAAEYWRAGWVASLDFHDEREADEASTWHRFATHPHAFKETP